MKKSEIYHLAQVAVVDSLCLLSAEEKLEVLRELMAKENMEAFCEREAEKE